MEKDTRYEIIIQALCVYAEKLEQKLREPGWVPVSADEIPKVWRDTGAKPRHIVTAKRSPGGPRKTK